MAKGKSKKTITELQLPPPEQMAKSEYRLEDTSPIAGAPKRVRNLCSTELDRLLFSGKIDREEHAILDGFRKDLYEAGMVFAPRAGFMPSGTSGQGCFIADRVYGRVRRVKSQMEALTKALDHKNVEAVLASLTWDARSPTKPVDLWSSASAAIKEFYD